MPDKELLFSKLSERIRGFATSRVGSGRAEDVAQETMLVIAEKYGDVTDTSECLRLAFKIARLKISNLWRLDRRRKTSGVDSEELERFPSEDDAPDREMMRSQMIDQLTKAMSGLTVRCREIFRMKLDGLRFAEIAKRLKVKSLNTVYVWDHRCRQRLKAELRRKFNWDI